MSVKANDPVGAGEKVIIERRQIVGVIEPDRNAKEGLLSAAFRVCGEYFQENDDMRGFDLQFKSYGRTFRAVMDPDPRYLESLGEGRGELEEED